MNDIKSLYKNGIFFGLGSSPAGFTLKKLSYKL